MTPFEVFTAARRTNTNRILKLRYKSSPVLLAIPLSAIACLIIKSLFTDPSVAAAYLAILYVAYIIFIRASNVIREYDTGNACVIAIYFTLSKWSLLGFVALHVYSPYSLIFIINMVVPDYAYIHAMILLFAGYLSLFLTDAQPYTNIALLYPVVLFVLSLLHFLLLFQEVSFKRSKKILDLLITACNLFFMLYFISYWGMYLYTHVSNKDITIAMH
ncbi:hypothetical protein NEAUS04_0138 [Nematocida ausubeli]|nr:hypothetical protein NEAUS04_0138 [Nematocida ausubeli]